MVMGLFQVFASCFGVGPLAFRRHLLILPSQAVDIFYFPCFAAEKFTKAKYQDRAYLPCHLAGMFDHRSATVEALFDAVLQNDTGGFWHFDE